MATEGESRGYRVVLAIYFFFFLISWQVRRASCWVLVGGCVALLLSLRSARWLWVPKLVAALWSQLSAVGKGVLGCRSACPQLNFIAKGREGTPGSPLELSFPVPCPHPVGPAHGRGLQRGWSHRPDPQHRSGVNLAPGNRCNGKIMEQILRNS